MNKNIPPEVTQKILEAFNQAGSANINTLQQVRDVQVVMGSLLQHETKRLEKKLGKENLRVQQVQASAITSLVGWVGQINTLRKFINPMKERNPTISPFLTVFVGFPYVNPTYN